MIRLGCMLLCLVYSFNSIALDQDSIIQFPKNRFFKSYFENNQVMGTIRLGNLSKIISLQNPILTHKYGFLIKTKTTILFCFDGASRVYAFTGQTDSAYIFSRLDQVENINYNINAYIFSYKNQLYNFGGYGFWKSNGLLRKYNSLNKEWDIVPLNKEIPCDQEFQSIWQAPEEENVYILFEHTVNEGIKSKEKNPNAPVGNVFTLNLTSQNVEQKGKLNELLVPIFLKSNVVHTNEGIIIIRSASSYYLKPKENQIYSIEDASINQSLGRLEWNCVHYFGNQMFYYWNIENNKFDSIDIAHLKLKSIGKIWQTDYSYYYASTLLLILIIIVVLAIKRKKKKTITPLNPKANDQIIQVPFLSETEISLIKWLIEKTEQHAFASATEINYIIGCKDKNVGLQKKMRSDIINSINAKYKAFSKTDQPFIESRRTDFDKRYFHYHITEDQLEKAKVFIALTAEA